MPAATWGIAQDQRRARQQAKATQDQANHGATILSPSDDSPNASYEIYIYNTLDREYVINQPPLFPALKIPKCPKGEKFSWTVIPSFVNEPYERPNTTERYYKRVDGRKCATSLLNPAAFPGIRWESQLQNWEQFDQSGNNLNAYGVFWSLTRPDDEEKLAEEIKLFTDRTKVTMQALVSQAEVIAASGKLGDISPLMHFAMDYFGKQAPWHMNSEHKVSCPNCGELVNEGIAYHKNSMGEKCIIDAVKYVALVRKQRETEKLIASLEAEADEPAFEEAPVATGVAAANQNQESKPAGKGKGKKAPPAA